MISRSGSKVQATLPGLTLSFPMPFCHEFLSEYTQLTLTEKRTSIKKTQNRRRSGGRGSRRASWVKDLLGRWLARRAVAEAISLVEAKYL
ncbi:MAG: hypothetical protein DMG06_22135 [Acidobacteria bacterium]|nr:MAG: hypothetical protein DMG06_22135 [Acidobacteriota bacterium]